MKIHDYERRVLQQRKTGYRKREESEIRRRCRETGQSEGKIKRRMKRHGLSLEEALVMKPMERQAVGRKGKQRSDWRHLGEEGADHDAE